MDSRSVDALRSAVDALNRGELEPLVDLMTDDMVWEGVTHGWLWWRQTPS